MKEALHACKDVMKGCFDEASPCREKIAAFYEDLTRRYPNLNGASHSSQGGSPWDPQIEHTDRHAVLRANFDSLSEILLGDKAATEVDDYFRKLARRHRLAVYDVNRVTLLYEDGSEPASVGTDVRVTENRGLTFPFAHVKQTGDSQIVGGILTPQRWETQYKWAEATDISLHPLAIEPGMHKVKLLVRCSHCGEDIPMDVEQQTFLLMSGKELANPGNRYSARNIFRNLMARDVIGFSCGAMLAAFFGGLIIMVVAGLALHWPVSLALIGFPLIFASSYGLMALRMWHRVTSGKDILLYIRPGWRGYQSASAFGYDDSRSFNLLTNVAIGTDTHFFKWHESGAYSAGPVMHHSPDSLLESYGFGGEQVWAPRASDSGESW